MKKILVLIVILLMVCFTYLYNYSYASTKMPTIGDAEANNYDLFFPDISKRTTPNNLLVMVFLYDDYTNHNQKTDFVFNMPDQEIETKYHNEIFGSGNTAQQTWSVNDFYKENSNGKFYFNPIIIDNNTTGIYPIRFNKTYNEENFSSDIEEGFKTLIDKGFVPSGFDYDYVEKTQENKVLCVFPKIAVAHLGSYFLNEDIYSQVAVIDFSSVVSTCTHELGHSIFLPDLYGQGDQATLMGATTLRSTIPDLRYPGAFNNYTIPAHIDPLHKIALGWHDYEIVDENSTVKLYPTTSPLYNMVIVPTEDNNQYYIIENRKADSFESQITMYASRGDIDDSEDASYSNYEGINIWRVDKLGYDELGAYQSCNRKGDYIISVLKNSMDSFLPKKYSNISDSNDYSKENTNIKITYIKNNPDNSIDIDISFADEVTNQYVVRYNTNDGTNTYIDNTYMYTHNIIFPTNLFSRDKYKFMGWNTKQDGSGITYNIDNKVYGLSDEDGAIVNLYAQWEATEYTISFLSNGGNGIMENQLVTLGEYTLPECIFTNSTQEFYGWFVTNRGVMEPGEIIVVDNNVELVAQWKPKNPYKISYTVTFNANGGSNVETQTVAMGKQITEPPAPKKEGYTFIGWYEDATYKFKFYFGRPIYADVTLYAKWISNDNVIKEMNINVQIPKVGEEVTIEKIDNEFWDFDSQKPQAIVIIPEEVHYCLADYDGNFNYMNWMSSLESEDQTPFIGKFEYNTDYYAYIYLESDSEYSFDNNINIIVNGKKVDKIIGISENYIALAVKLTTEEKTEIIEYTILDGKEQIYSVDDEKDLTVRADGEISKFVELKIDGISLETENYTVTSGSTIATIKKEYLNKLEGGKHVLTFVYKDGEISTDFTITTSKTNDNSNIVTDNNNINDNTKIIDKTANTTSSPKTGDNIILWIALFIFSILGSLVTYKYLKKKS